MSGDTFTLRDRSGQDYKVRVTDDRVTVDDADMRTAFLDDAVVRVDPVEPRDERSVERRGATAHAVRDGDTLWVFLDGRVFTFEADAGGRRRRARAIAGSLTAPMPATVRRIETKPGQPVRRGDILIVLEAMKMELPVRAPADGTVARVNCREGELVQAGQELVELQP